MKKIFQLTLLIATIAISACYFDSDERINYDLSVCDPNNVTYNTCVKTIMDNNCKGCHSESRADGGVKLDSYTSVKANFTASMADINSGKMPKNAAKLSDADIATLEAWETQGFVE